MSRARPTTVRFQRESLRERVKLLAEMRAQSMGRYIAWCAEQVVELPFLSPVNRELVRERAAAHRPNSELAVIDDVISEYRELLDAGKIPPSRSAGMRQGRLFALALDVRQAERESA